jgi:hypothetical protein
MWAAPSTLTLPECSISDGKITLIETAAAGPV